MMHFVSLGVQKIYHYMVKPSSGWRVLHCCVLGWKCETIDMNMYINRNIDMDMHRNRNMYTNKNHEHEHAQEHEHVQIQEQ
jgi:hypothetical protein